MANAPTQGKGESVALNAAQVAEVTGGQWEGLDSPELRFTGVAVGGKLNPGELCITQNPEQWGKDIPNNEGHLSEFAGRGAAAFVVRRGVTVDSPLPVLRVDNTREALRTLAEENLRRIRARRIFVTGTEGKTGFKLMLHHVMQAQTPVHAILDSSNLHVPIWRSLASIQLQDRFAIIEASVAQPKRGIQRSRFVKAHVCVITNISPQHTRYHGSVEQLIANKADSVVGLQPWGVAMISADNAYYHQLKTAVQQRRSVPVLSFGRERFCEGRLLCAEFVPERGGWQVSAAIFGKPVEFFVGMVNSYAPLAAVSVLLLVDYLGLDLEQAARTLADYHGYETSGRIVHIPIGDGHFTLFDHSHRGSVAGFRSAFDDLYRLAGDRRVVLVLGAVLDLADADKQSVHRELATMIDPSRVRRVITVGDEMRITRAAITDQGILGGHGDNWTEVQREVFETLELGDVVLVKGHHRVWLSRLVERMERHFGPVHPVDDASAKATPSPTSASRYRLVAGGDLMLGRDVPGRHADQPPEWVFGDVAPLLRGADLTLANLECVLTTGGRFWHKAERRPYYFGAPPPMTDLLVGHGINVVTTANNHAMDFGPAALAEQQELLAACGIAAPGSGADLDSAARPAYLQVGDVTIAVIAFETESPLLAPGTDHGGVFHVGRGPGVLRRLAPVVEEARHRADLVVASPHWGANWADRPRQQTRELAHELLALGVDAVLGHSSHVFQGVEVCGGRPIVYDMGSLLFDRVKEGRLRLSMLFELGFDKRGFHSLTAHPIRLFRSRTRLAEGTDAEQIRQTMRTLTAELAPHVSWQESDDGALCLPLFPPSRSPAERDSGAARPYRRAALEPLPDPLRRRPLKVVHDTSPAPLPTRGLAVGAGLELLGVGYPEAVRAGRGFVFAVLFRCPETHGRRWRAALEGRPRGGGSSFEYRHPVADGLWVPQTWRGDGVIESRVVIRPPAKLAPDRYDLYWRLYDSDTGKPWPFDTAVEGVEAAGIHIGAVQMDRTSPVGVAGVAWGQNLVLRPLTQA